MYNNSLCRKSASLGDKAKLHAEYFEASRVIATDARYAHEYGVSMVTPKPLEIDFDVKKELPAAAVVSRGQDAASVEGTLNSRSKFSQALNGTRPVKGVNAASTEIQYNGHVNGSPAADTRPAIRDSLNHNNLSTSKARFEQKVTSRQDVKQLEQHHSSQSNNMKSMFDASISSHAAPSTKRAGADTNHTPVRKQVSSTGVKSHKVMALLARSHGDYEQVLHYCATKIQVRDVIDMCRSQMFRAPY